MVTKKGKSSAEAEAPAQAGAAPAGEKKWRTAGEADVWQPVKRGEFLMGTFTSSFHYLSKKFKNECTAYKVLTPEGMRLVFGTDRLNRDMEEVPKGSTVKITYLGKNAEEIHEWKVDYQAPAPF